METLSGIVGSGLLSWLITHAYYKKSMQQQSRESQEEIQKLLSILEQQQNNSREVFIAKVLEEAIKEYKQAGTPVKVLDSYNLLTTQEKSDLYDKVMIRVKGRLGKSNKYKTNMVL
jgi:hypothetical protein